MKKIVFILALAIFFSCQLLSAQNFITRWDLSIGVNVTQISFGTATNGIVNYTWKQLTGGAATGSGSWSGTKLTITGLPSGAVIRLEIIPINFQRINIDTGANCQRLIDVEQWGSTVWTSMQTAFSGCSNLQVTANDIPDLSKVTNMSYMFWGCTNLNSPANINNWNIGAVTNMSHMFWRANIFNQNIGSWNTATVTNMQWMFAGAYAFNQPIGFWNTAAVTNMSGMFLDSHIFNQPIGSWNTAAVTNMSGMFEWATSFNQPIGTWNTAAVTNMSEMFEFDTVFNQPIGTWNTAAVTNMSGMFEWATSFNQNIGSWNTGAVTSMWRMFLKASVFNQNIGSWNTANVNNMESMFYLAIAFNQNIGSWNTAAVTNMSDMFAGAFTFNQPIGSWNTAAVTDMLGMFVNTTSFSQNIGSWNTAAVTNMQWMLYHAIAFNQNIGAWTLNPAVDMRIMLDSCGMDCSNYSATLIGWNANPSTPNSRNLGAAGMKYGSPGVAARANLVLATASGGKGWTISGDALSSVSPIFAAVGPYCSGAAIPALPTISTNSITGTWSPSINNTATTLYTFTPSVGQCAESTTLTIAITMTSSLAPSVSIAAYPGNTICAGTNVTFTATATNGGTTPSYQWKLNGNNVGANSPTYQNVALANGDVVTCILTSSTTCVTSIISTSNAITITILAVNFYPNPADGNTTLVVSPELNGGTAVAWNELGQKVTQWAVGGCQTTYQFEWAAGVYMIEIRKGAVREVRKLVIIR